jgi:hypothetical protein
LIWTVLARSIFTAVLLFVILGPWRGSLMIGALTGIGTAALICARMKATGYWSVVIELVGNSVLVIGTGIATYHMELDFRAILIEYSTTDERIAVVLIAIGGILFLGKGSTYIVRGLLESAGAMPRFTSDSKKTSSTGWTVTASYSVRNVQRTISVKEGSAGGTGKEVIIRSAKTPSDADTCVTTQSNEATETAVDPTTPVGGSEKEEPPDSTEYRRGRLIGNIERLVVGLLAALGSYPAIAFVLTAKGLVRAKEFEDRDYAEYFLVGTLASCALALSLGIAFRAIVHRVR